MDAFQQRHRVLGFPLAVVYKYFDDAGPQLSALLSYYGFVSLFPLLLLASTLLDVVLDGNPELRERVLETALDQIPLLSDDLTTRGRIGGGAAGLAIGVGVALYGGLRVSLGLQNAMNTIWRVPRNDRPNPFLARAQGLLLLLTVGVALLGLTALTGVANGAAGTLGPLLRRLALGGTLALLVVVFTITFRVTTARPLSWGQVAPGAVLAAGLWQLLQTFGATYVGQVVASASAGTTQAIAVVLGLVAFLYVASVGVVLCAQVNAVRVDRLWPRALLTPLTDDVDLTRADERAYAGQARAERAKGFEEISVHFRDRPERRPEQDGSGS